MTAFQRMGTYAVIDGRDHWVEIMRGEVLLVISRSTGPRPEGWQDSPGGTGYQRRLTPSEVDRLVAVSYKGTYRGVPVSVYPGFGADVEIATHDVKAGIAVGMRSRERGEASASIDPADPDLDFVQIRRDIPFPGAAGRTG